MIKICLVIPSLQAGGMERVMAELALFFSKREGIKVELILYGKTREVFFPVPDNISVHKPKFSFTDYRRIISTFKTLVFLRKKVKSIDPDVVLSFGEYWNSFVLLALFGLKYPVYVSDRCKPTKSLGKFHDLLRKWLYPKAAGIIAQTSKAKEVYEQQKLNENIKVIGNPIYDVCTNGEPYEKENIILTVGRLIKTKHHDRLVKIFKNISASGWKLVIVGGDALKQPGMKRLKKLIEKLDMEDDVELPGMVTNVESYYRRSKIFALTSSSEGFPNVIGEAMSAELPVISYDCVAGPSDMIDDGENGFLIPLYKDNLFAEKLEKLIKNDDLRARMGNKSREKIQNFSIENIGRKYFEFITNNL